MSTSVQDKQYTYRLDEVFETATPVGFVNAVEHIVINYMYNRNWAMCLVGESGEGKNRIIEKAFQLLGHEVILFSGLGMLPEDIGGMPGYGRTLRKPREAYDKVDDILYDFLSTEQKYNYYLFEHIERAFDPKWKGCLFVDEIARCEDDTRRKIYQFVYDRELNGRKLSPGCMVVMSMNPPGLSEYNLQPLDKPFEDRIAIIPVKSSESDWLAFADGKQSVYDHIIEKIMKYNHVKICKSRSDDQMISRPVYRFVKNNTRIYQQMKGRRLHHMSDAIIATEKYFGVDVKTAFRNTSKYTHERRIFTEIITATTIPDIATKFVVQAGTEYQVSGLGILTGKHDIGDYRDMMKDISSAAMVTKVNDDITDSIVNKFETFIRESDYSDQVEYETAITIAIEHAVEYLFVLDESSHDIAVSFLTSMSTAGKKWKDFMMLFGKVLLKPEYKSRIDGIYANARLKIVTSPATSAPALSNSMSRKASPPALAKGAE